MLSLLFLIASCDRPTAAATQDEAPLAGPAKKPIDASTTAAAPVRMPSDQVIVRQCYAQTDDKVVSHRSSPPPPPSAAKTVARAPTTVSTPVVPAAPMAAPAGNAALDQGMAEALSGATATDGSAGLGTLGTKGTGSGQGYGASGGLGASGFGVGGGGQAEGQVAGGQVAANKPTESKSEAPAPVQKAAKAPSDAPAAEPVQAVAQSAPRPDANRESERDNSNEQAEKAKKGDATSMAGRAKDEEAARMVEDRSQNAAEDSRWDWGGTTYLSNDDSMSLASAQRLLWALQKRGPVQASEIRPHEFLNYFSFDTRPVQQGDTFSVEAAAESTGPDTLTMSMAVKGWTPPRQAMDLTIVLDRSGSMSAEGRMDYLKRGLQKMSKDSLKTGDRVDVVLFDDELCVPLENYVVGRDDPSILDNVINGLSPRGSTDLDLGLREGYRIASHHVDTDGRNRRMLLITDALLNTGDVNPDTVSQIGKAYEESNIRLTGIGVGREFNDKVLNKLTEKGKGAYVYLGSEAVVDRIFGVGFESLVQTIAHNVRFELDLPPSLALERFYGEESSTNPEEVQPINYYAGTTQLFLQDLHVRPTGAVKGEQVALTIHFEDPQTGAQKSQRFEATVGELLAAESHNIRKARALMAWTDMLTARALGSSPCGAPFSTYKDRVSALGSDTEIDWLDGLTRPLCGETAPPPRPQIAGVSYKVKVDSDIPIAEVGLDCAGSRWSESLSGSDTIALFSATPGASCTLTLQGSIPMQTTVQVPVTGGDLRCMVRGGRMNCS